MQVELVQDGKVPFRNASTGPVNDVWDQGAEDLYQLINNKIETNQIPKPCFAHVGFEASDLNIDKNDSKKRLF